MDPLPYLAVCACGWAARRRTFAGVQAAGDAHRAAGSEGADHVLNVAYDRPRGVTEICPAWVAGRACKRPAGHRGLHDLV